MAAKRIVDLNKKRAAAIEAALSATEDEQAKLSALTFQLDGETYTSVDKISHMVGMHIGRLGNEDYSNAQQSESVIYCLEHLIGKDDRKKFSKWLEESEMTSTEMIALLGTIIEELTGNFSESKERPGKATKVNSSLSLEE